MIVRPASAQGARRIDPPRKATTTAAVFTLQTPAEKEPQQVDPPADPPALKLLQNIERQRSGIDAAVQRARRGESFSPTELLALQAQVYQYAQQIEVVSRVVDRTVNAVKTALNVQV